MIHCLNPNCPKPVDPLNANGRFCRNCGLQLLLQGRYRLIKLLGKGGFGKTFEVDDCGKRKVLKVLLKNYSQAVSLFQREAEVLSYLHHPGIPRVEPNSYFTVLPTNSQKPLHCLVMEKIEGSTLSQWLAAHGNQPISQEQAINWLEQLVEILEQLHKQHYFHRDIKPSNIMLKPNGQLVLIDFGAVREVTETYMAKLAQDKITGVISPGFSPPEQAEGRAVPQSDFFSLGRTFVYLLTGTPPVKFPEDRKTGKLIWRINAPQISKSLAGLIDYLMAPFPGKRPHNVQEILNCIAEIKAIPHYYKPASITSPAPKEKELRDNTALDLAQSTTNVLPLEFET